MQQCTILNKWRKTSFLIHIRLTKVLFFLKPSSLKLEQKALLNLHACQLNYNTRGLGKRKEVAQANLAALGTIKIWRPWKLFNFQDPSPPLSSYVQNSFTLLTLYVQFETNLHEVTSHSNWIRRLLFDLAHKQCIGIIKGWLHCLESETKAKGRFLANNILLAWCLVMTQIQLSLNIKK